MRRPSALLLLIVLSLSWLASTAPASAQASRSAANLTLAQAERAAADLKQGMTLSEVQRMLGKPRRTALTGEGMFQTSSSQRTLQWTYSWGSPGQDSLKIQFAAKTPEEWYVNSWQWSSY